MDAERVDRSVHVYLRVVPGPEADMGRLLRTWEATPAVLETVFERWASPVGEPGADYL